MFVEVVLEEIVTEVGSINRFLYDDGETVIEFVGLIEYGQENIEVGYHYEDSQANYLYNTSHQWLGELQSTIDKKIKNETKGVFRVPSVRVEPGSVDVFLIVVPGTPHNQVTMAGIGALMTGLAALGATIKSFFDKKK